MENKSGRKGLGRRQILRNAGAVTATAVLMCGLRDSFAGVDFGLSA